MERVRDISNQSDVFNGMWRRVLMQFSRLLVIYSIVFELHKQDYQEVFLFHCASGLFYLLTSLWLNIFWSPTDLFPSNSPSLRLSVLVVLFQLCWFFSLLYRNFDKLQNKEKEAFELVTSCVPISSFYFGLIFVALKMMRDNFLLLNQDIMEPKVKKQKQE